MGWWSATVMGGDSPLDAEGDLFHIAFKGTKYEDGCDRMDAEDAGELTREDIAAKLLARLPALVEYVGRNTWFDSDIARQVLGVMILEYGVPIIDPTREAIEHAIQGAKDDEWASEDEERAAHMEAFILQLNEYDGKPTEVKFEGLFEKLAEKLADGSLLNVNTK